MPQNSLVFVFNDNNQILLSMKKRAFGVGKWNGAGGKTMIGETVKEGAIRELEEETGIKLKDGQMESSGLLHFIYKAKPEWNQDVHVYTSRGYKGEFKETEEMMPKWFDLNEIPYDTMWEDDVIWLKHVIDGENIEFEFIFGMDSKIEEYKKIR